MSFFTSLWYKHLGGKNQVWADVKLIDNKFVVKDYNAKFVEDAKSKMGDVAYEKTDKEIVGLYFERENLELEEPRLEVVHMGVDADGKVKMELDWNKSFIDHLRKNGIVAESEDEAIDMYLSMLERKVSKDMILEYNDNTSDELYDQLEAKLESAKKLVND